MNVEIQKQFRDIVEHRLAELGWSRADLARAMDDSPQIVTNYLNGHKNAGPETMERFFTALGLAPELTVKSVAKPRKRPLQTAG
jgi:plasmid maintenance system antidote protein VapI